MPGEDLRVGRIVEVEAYIGVDDLASHARFGRTARNRVMFGPPGIAYVYLVYGMYACLNVVTEPADRPAAVLIRAVAPVSGEAAMRRGRVSHELRRRKATRDIEAGSSMWQALSGRIESIPTHRLASGPGLVAAAFGIDRSLTGVDLCASDSPLRLETASSDEERALIVATSRIGIDYAGEPWRSRPWRFAVRGDASVSGPSVGSRAADGTLGGPPGGPPGDPAVD